VTNTPINYDLLLTENFQENEFWTDLTTSMGNLFNPNIQNAIEILAKLRAITVEPYFAGLNLQMVGFRVPVLSFNADEYQRLMKYIGIFIQTRGASGKFVDFIGFIKNAPLFMAPLWANDITNIDSLTDSPGTAIWNGGDYFPTSFYDVYVDIDLAPGASTDDIAFLLRVLEPIHLVLRNVIEIERYHLDIMAVPYALEEMEDIGYATRMLEPMLDDIGGPFILDTSRTSHP
jgi:hypothetical protein